MTAWRRFNLESLAASIKGLGEPEPDADLDANLAFLADLREQKAALVAVENEVERIAAKQMPRRTYETTGLSAERSNSYADTWDLRRAARAIVEPALMDADTGEVFADDTGAWRILDRLLAVAHIGYFRATEMKAAGLDPEDFRKRELRRTTVKVTRAVADE